MLNFQGTTIREFIKKPLKTHQFPKLTQNKFVVLLMVATLQIQEFETQGSGV